MIPDITIRDYYLQFIHNAKIDIAEYNKNFEVIKTSKEEVYNYLFEHIEDIKNEFGIVLSSYDKEWNNKIYNSSKRLYNAVITKLSIIPETTDKSLLIQIAKYCGILYNEYKYNKLIAIVDKRKDIKFRTYRKYVTAYYTKVHKCVLEGMGYKFGYGIGTYVINYWKLDAERIKRKPRLDFAATAAKKKELISKGIKLYDNKEATWYAERHIPYDGVDYRVYKEDTNWYELTFINSSIFKRNNLNYQHTEYIVSKYRGMSYMQMANQLCKTLDDIYNLQVDIKYKLNILLYKYPTKYLNYVRTAEQYKYKC